MCKYGSNPNTQQHATPHPNRATRLQVCLEDIGWKASRFLIKNKGEGGSAVRRIKDAILTDLRNYESALK